MNVSTSKNPNYAVLFLNCITQIFYFFSQNIMDNDYYQLKKTASIYLNINVKS